MISTWFRAIVTAVTSAKADFSKASNSQYEPLLMEDI